MPGIALWVTIVLQFCGLLTHATILAFVQEPLATKIHVFVGLLQGILGAISHYYNPDGTPAKVAYDPDKGSGHPPLGGGMGLAVLLLALMPIAQAAGVKVLAVPQPMEVVSARVGAARPPMGLWYLHLQNTGDQAATVTREQIVIALSEWCQKNRVGKPLFLDKTVAGPVLLKSRGGKWLRFLQWAATYGGSGAAIAGIPWAATAVPISDFVGRAAGAAVPDVSTLQLELPATVQIAPGAGATLQAWSGRMRKPPDVIGPIEL